MMRGKFSLFNVNDFKKLGLNGIDVNRGVEPDVIKGWLYYIKGMSTHLLETLN